MTEKAGRGTGERSNPEDKQIHHNADQREQEHDVEIPAIRHVGPTLESAETEEGQALSDAVNMLRDTEEKSSIYEPGPDAPRVKTGVDPLVTRLPGDTSSEPHTDVGPDNATVIQHRGEDRRR